jgi:hypothetical protein
MAASVNEVTSRLQGEKMFMDFLQCFFFRIQNKIYKIFMINM